MKIGSVYVEILNKCNMRCRYCYNSSSIDNNSQISCEQFVRIVDLMKKYKCKNIWISGGEPFLHPDIKEILSICMENRFNVGIATNGSLISKYISTICKYNPDIQISLDSPDEYLNDEYRGKNAFINAVSAIDFLNKSNYSGSISIKSTLCNKNCNIESINQMVTFCEKYNINDVFFSPCLSQGRANKEHLLDKFPIISEEDIKKSNTKIHYTRLIHSCELLGDIIDEPLNLRISSMGDVYPCHHLPYIIFNCFEYTDDFKANKSLFEIKEKLCKLVSKNNFCASCICKNICNGGCPAMYIIDSQQNDLLCNFRREDHIKKIKAVVGGGK